MLMSLGGRILKTDSCCLFVPFLCFPSFPQEACCDLVIIKTWKIVSLKVWCFRFKKQRTKSTPFEGWCSGMGDFQVTVCLLSFSLVFENRGTFLGSTLLLWGPALNK